MNNNDIYNKIGNTPLIRLSGLENAFNLKCRLYGKWEGMNLTGSAKDRPALQMILKFEEEGKLKEGGCIIEPTSGNTGIALAAIGQAKGYQVILTMPDSMSKERIDLLKSYGATVELTPGKLGMTGAIEKAKELQAKMPGSIIPSQFDNQENPHAHYLTTGPEIYRDLDGKVDVLVSGVGSGGTISGCSKYLKERCTDLHVVAVEPEKSPVLRGGQAGPHGLQGIGANFVPENYDASLVDEIVDVKEEDAYEKGRALYHLDNIMAGISSGAALQAAIEIAPKFENKNVVVILPDKGDRYLSTPLYSED